MDTESAFDITHYVLTLQPSFGLEGLCEGKTKEKREPRCGFIDNNEKLRDHVQWFK